MFLWLRKNESLQPKFIANMLCVKYPKLHLLCEDPDPNPYAAGAMYARNALSTSPSCAFSKSVALFFVSSSSSTCNDILVSHIL